jgi:hypothetical protein
MSTTMSIFVNTDSVDQPYNLSGVEFTEISLDNDYIIFTNGSTSVADGQPIPSQAQLNSAGVLLTGVEQVVPTYLLADISEDELKSIYGMGNNNNRYVMAFVFDGATASEPVLELWDDTNLDSINNVSLGEGVPSSSWWRGITTTDGLPGADWTGSRLAGSSSGYFLWLNNEAGALTGADVLYCNLKIVIPATATEPGAENPVFVVKYTSN